MRVLLVTGSFPPMRCGVGDYTDRLARSLADAPGMEVGVLTSDDAVPDATSRIRVLPIMPDWSARRLAAAWAAVRRFRPDVIHVQYPTQGYAPRPATASLLPLVARAFGIPVVRTWHEPPPPEDRWFVAHTVAGVRLIYTRPSFPDQLTARARRALNGGGVLVPIASNMPRSLLSGPERERLRLHHLDGKRRLVVFFGFLYPAKGVELLFEIARAETDRLVIAGERPDDAYYRQLREIAEAPPWNGSPSFVGYLSDEKAADLMAAADAVVLPFRGGGGVGNGTILAASLQGTSVVTTAATPRALDEATGIYQARIDDVAEMRAALDRLAGRRWVTGEVDDWRRIVEAHLAIYRAVCGATGRG